MTSTKQSSVFNFHKSGGLGFCLPQSEPQFNWRNDPTIISFREFLRNTIEVYLAQSPSGEFRQQIAELAAYLEDGLFMGALSKEDYTNQEKFHVRLQFLIQQKWFQAKVAQQEALLATALLPMRTATPTVRMLKSDSGTNSIKPLYDSIVTGNTATNLVHADNVNQPHFAADVSRISLSGSQKQTFDITLGHPEQVVPDNCCSGQGFSSGETVDSGPTFSGSVLQYDSEASFESHHIKSQHLAEGELNLYMTNSYTTPSAVDENLKLEFPTICDKVHVQQPVLEPEQFQGQQSWPGLQFNEHSHGEDESCGETLVQNKNSLACDDATSTAKLLPCYDGSVQRFSCSDVSLGSANKLLCCYIAYNKHFLIKGANKIPFLEYLHSQKCKGGICGCEEYKLLLSHFDSCGSGECGVCGPALRMCSAGIEQPGFRNPRNQYNWKCGNISANETWHDTSEDFMMKPAKCRKLNTLPRHGSSYGVSMISEDSLGPLKFEHLSGSLLAANPHSSEATMNPTTSLSHNLTIISEADNNAMDDLPRSNYDGAPTPYEDLSTDFKEDEPASSYEIKDRFTDCYSRLPCDCFPSLSEEKCTAPTEEVILRSDSEETEPRTSEEGFHPTVPLSAAKLEKQKVDGISLTDFFTLGEIRQHLSSLREKVDKGIAEEVVKNTENCSVSENICQLCALDRLAFPPVPIFCSACGARIKNHGTYYSTKDENRAQFCFCSSCFNKSRGGNITFYGVSIPKIDLLIKKNNLMTEEWWVQCDKCEGWQHQICALFNDKRDLGGKAEYVCPRCYLEDLENEEHMPLPQSTAFVASNLPQTLLSDHIEQRLFRRLKQEREDRAKAAGKNPEEVPGPADLVVRVVSSVDKILKVKKRFLDIFPEKNYPAEFPYRSKVILLFQRIEGVDVCLFAMYVQEFGSECSRPNQRCVYISYLDSVKYFRPETKAASGEALRTFVYHEILVAYLDYCKKRGFATCYIWACPPVKGEDYILYCHPETQRTPRPDKLRQWYQLMLKKATNENIVVSFTNLYEQFFVPNGECNNKVTAARLPYFDGDYWSSVADSMINKIEQESKGDVQKHVKKMSRRSLKAMGHTNPSIEEAKDILLMQQLAQTISSAKEDFIIVYLQFVCTHCHEVILSGKRWFCNQCKNYQLCERCHDTDLYSGQGNTHITSIGQKHVLSQEIVNDVPVDTEDNDAIMDNCFLENRHAFLSFCQGNHYQFDSLRRAKHSSMMILYHLHNPNKSNIRTFCSLCLKDVVFESRWKCEMCPEFIVCGTCYQRNNASCHHHTLTYHRPTNTRGTKPKMGEMVGELLDVVLHASQCRATITHPCSYPNCTLIRRLFSHAHSCNVRVAGGCLHCKKTWFVLKMHSQTCNYPNCGVPRCMDLRKYAESRQLGYKSQKKKTLSDSYKQSMVMR